MYQTEHHRNFNLLMHEGESLMQTGRSLNAMHKFEDAYIHAGQDSNRVEALRMASLMAIKCGVLNKALELLNTAMLETSTGNVDELKVAQILRDRSDVHHSIWLYKLGSPKYKDEFATNGHYFDAKEGLEKSIEILDNIDSRSTKIIAEAAASKGFLGSLLFDSGEVRNGKRLLKEAQHTFDLLGCKDSSYEAYRANNLIREMKTKSFFNRLKELPLALKLTSRKSKSAGLRRRVYAAMAGNRTYNWLMLRGIHDAAVS